MRILRLIGWLFILIALGLLVHEGILWLDGESWTIVSAHARWTELDAASLAAVDNAARDLSPIAANAFRTIMGWPAWAVVGGIGLLLVAIASARRRGKRSNGRKRIFRS
jgi:TRAP-type C4-dicarboxylate transport system permease small subunit